MAQDELSYDDVVGAPPAAAPVYGPGSAYSGQAATPAQQAYAQANQQFRATGAPAGSAQNPSYDTPDLTGGATSYHVNQGGQLVAPEMSYDDAFAGGPLAAPKGVSEIMGFEKGLAEPYQNFWAKVSKSPFLKSLTDSMAAAFPEFEIAQDATSQLAPKVMADVNAKAAQGYAPGQLGQFGGTLAGGVFLPGGPMTQGAMQGVLDSNAQDVPGLAVDAVKGAAINKLGSSALGAISRLVQPQVAPAVQTLIDEGVPLTAGQIQGGALKRIEDAAKSLPIVGDVVGNAQRRSIEGLNRAVANRALAPIGETLPADVAAGRDAIAHAGDQLSDRYEALIPTLTVRSDPQLGADIASIGAAASKLPTEHANLLGRVIGDHIVNKFDPATGVMSGEDLKDAESTLGQMIGRYSKSPMPADQNFADGLSMTRQALRDLVARSNPHAADELANLNRGWANLAIGEKAAGALGAEDGLFSPSQLAGAVKAANSTVRKRGYARGEALMQDLSDAALNTLPQRVPDSGTPFRHALEAGVGAAVGKEAGLGHLIGQGTVVGGLMSLPYTEPGQKLFQELLAGSRPAAAAPVASALDRLRFLARNVPVTLVAPQLPYGADH